MTNVAIGICTLRRPDRLRRLLESVAELPYPGVQMHVVVVDNDGEQSARPIVESFGGRIRHLHYDVEPRPGLSAARNRVARNACATGASHIAFLDDDQRVRRDWLAKMIYTAEAHGADAVSAPVIPVYERGVPKWLKTGRFFDRDRFASGAEVRPRWIGGLLVRRDWLEGSELPFGEGFQLYGDDAYFLARLHDAGARTFWCDEAEIYESIPHSRATPRWLIWRSYEQARVFSELLGKEPINARRYATRVLKCQVRIVQGLLELVPAIFRGRAALVIAVCRVSGGIGGLRGLTGAVKGQSPG
jgi:GT2 family glycosyltransferase